MKVFANFQKNIYFQGLYDLLKMKNLQRGAAKFADFL